MGFDDGLAIIIYVFAITVAKHFLGGSEGVAMYYAVLFPLKGILGAIALVGAGAGWAYGYLSKRMRTKGELLTVCLGTILACTGLANFFGLSLILANLVLGIVVASAFAPTGRRTLEVVESITPPMYVIFFVLAGAHLQIGLLSQAGVAIGLAILVGRELGGVSEQGRYLSILTINTIAATTIIFEIVGPITTKFAVSRAEEIGQAGT